MNILHELHKYRKLAEVNTMKAVRTAYKSNLKSYLLKHYSDLYKRIAKVKVPPELEAAKARKLKVLKDKLIKYRKEIHKM